VFYQGTISCVAGTAKLVVLPNLTSCQEKNRRRKRRNGRRQVQW